MRLPVAILLFNTFSAVHAAEAASNSMATLTRCRATQPAGLTINLGDKRFSTPLSLRARLPLGLELASTSTGQVVWSSGPDIAATQRIPEMTANFGSSLTAIDSNSDGTHDRVYAGDAAGRLWRFDLHPNSTLSALLTGGIMANFSNGAATRPILAAPDVALITPPRGEPWLNIAIGTTRDNAGNLRAGFFLVRDPHVFDALPQHYYTINRPLLASNLLDVTGPIQSSEDASSARGYALNLSSLQVYTQSLTVEGRTIFLAAADSSQPNASCDRQSYAGSINALTGSAAIDLNSDNTVDDSDRLVRLATLPLASSVHLAKPTAASLSTQHVCKVAQHSIPNCTVDLHARRSYWMRADAD
jgi:hypothetical protein